VNENDKGEGSVFRDESEALMAYQAGAATLHAKIKVRRTLMINGVAKTKIVDATIGRIIFNQPIPQDLGFIDRSTEDGMFEYEISVLVKKKTLGNIIDKCIRVHGTEATAVVLDAIKAQGFKYSTKSAITVAVCDAVIPPQKKHLLELAEEQITKINKLFNRGQISNEERYKAVIEVWDKTTKEVSDALTANLSDRNPIYMMADSGARGSIAQIRQLAGMRGLLANTAGKTIET
ncbi:MAG: DNA-directed RNA polymerase subunit beta', partial [Oscillospiraceae bacterium]